MFLMIVAWVVFVVSSFIGVSCLWDVRPTQENLEWKKARKDLDRIVYGVYEEYSFWRIIVLVLVWVVSGWYIFP